MTTNNHDTTRQHLKEYLSLSGHAVGKNNILKCPAHNDENPSAVYYDQGKKSNHPVIWCPVCEFTGGIFDVAGKIHNTDKFPEQVKIVESALNITHVEPAPEPVPVAVDIETARTIYSREAIPKLKPGAGDITGSWKYLDTDGRVMALDVRFEKEGERKQVITYWYDGEKLTVKNPPVLIYNLPDALQSDKPVLIVEGAKCCDIAKTLDDFVPVSWSGGTGKVSKVDWTVFKGRTVYILPDDDAPGVKAAEQIRKQLPEARIIGPLDEPRALKQSGADIEQILQVMTPRELTEIILAPPAEPKKPELPQPEGQPFKVLGIGDDGKANFITHAGRHVAYNMESISKEKLRVLSDHTFWRTDYPNGKNGVDWDGAIDYILRASEIRDFDKDSIRGRGAWIDGEKISYHDGINTHGEWDPRKTYLRLRKNDIGICDPPAGRDIINRLREVILKLSFQTPADAVRVMGWAVLAPFAGALKYRPSILLTGPSGSGKSTVQEVILRKLTDFIWCDTKETSTAGIRSKIAHDATCVFFEEADKSTDKMKLNVNDILAFARSNYSANSPDGFKGTKDGGYVTYKMTSMFGFAAINPGVEEVADENRIFRINMKKPSGSAVNEWRENEAELNKILTEANCRGVRAFTWRKLKQIIKVSEKIVDPIRHKTGRDYRSSYADSLLASAFIVIWQGVDEPTQEQIDRMLDKYYSLQPVEEHRDEAAELLNRLLDEIIEVIHHDNKREKITVSEGLMRVHTGIIPSDGPEADEHVMDKERMTYKRTLARYGVAVGKHGEVVIANNHHAVKKILNVGNGYEKILQRHKGYVKSDGKSFTGDTTRRAVFIEGILSESVDETLGRLL